MKKQTKLPKKVIDIPTYNVQIPFSDYRPKISKYVESMFQARWNDCSHNKLHDIKDKFSTLLQIYVDNRKEDVVLTRLRIGHTRLTHKHYLLNEEIPMCITCDAFLYMYRISKQLNFCHKILLIPTS